VPKEPVESQSLSPRPAPLLSFERRTGFVRPSRKIPSSKSLFGGLRCLLKPPLRIKSVSNKSARKEFAPWRLVRGRGS